VTEKSVTPLKKGSRGDKCRHELEREKTNVNFGNAGGSKKMKLERGNPIVRKTSMLPSSAISEKCP